MVEDIVCRGTRDGSFRDVDPRLTTLALFGMCNWSYQWYRQGGRSRRRRSPTSLRPPPAGPLRLTARFSPFDDDLPVHHRHRIDTDAVLVGIGGAPAGVDVELEAVHGHRIVNCVRESEYSRLSSVSTRARTTPSESRAA